MYHRSFSSVRIVSFSVFQYEIMETAYYIEILDYHSGVASPKKVGGPNHVSSLVSSNLKLQYTYMGYPPICEKTFQRICANPKRGLNRSGGGPDPSIPPVATPLDYQNHRSSQ